MRIAAIDVGSNSIHLVVVEADAVGNQRVLAREKVMVRLAKGIVKSGAIAADAFQAGLEALALMTEIIRGFDCRTILAFGTAALREASNARAFIEEAAGLGLPIRVISGEEEARLIFTAVRHAVPFPQDPVTLVDIGGGSTELTWIHGERVLASLSLPWGIQRLADALASANPPSAEDLKAVKKFIRKVLRKAGESLPLSLPRTGLILGTSGTLLDLGQGASGESSFTLDQLQRFERKLWRTSAQERVDQFGVDVKRAEVLHVGSSWALAIMEWVGADQVRCLPVGLREGMIWDALRHGGLAIPALSDRRASAIQGLAAKLDPDPAHSRQVMRLADQLFMDLRPLFELGDPEREWLGYAAQLHDIGLSIAEKDHHKHGAYLVQNAHLPGFWHKETEIISQVVRFHRGKTPSEERHEAFARLAPWHRQVVEKLAAILRTADALDRSRRQRVQSLRLNRRDGEVVLLIQASGGIRPELESLQEKGLLLLGLLGLPVRTVVTEHAAHAERALQTVAEPQSGRHRVVTRSP